MRSIVFYVISPEVRVRHDEYMLMQVDKYMLLTIPTIALKKQESKSMCDLKDGKMADTLKSVFYACWYHVTLVQQWWIQDFRLGGTNLVGRGG